MQLLDCLRKILEQGRRIPIGVGCLAVMFVLLSQCMSADQQTNVGTVATIPNTADKAAPTVGEAAPDKGPVGEAAPDRGPPLDASPYKGVPRGERDRGSVGEAAPDRGRVYEALPPAGAPAPDFVRVRVHYATDRNYVPGAQPAAMYGTGRGTLSFGYCDVSIPREHRAGELETRSLWRLEFRDDPAKHVVLLSALVRSRDEFFGDVAARVRSSPKSSAFIFVHGYNVTFEDAARRTAQISYDLGFEGAPVFYSWPSQGKTLAYPADEQNIEWAQANLKTFLEEFFTQSGAQNVYLIAHSMGNRALARAVGTLLAEKPSLKERLKEVILTAPDIDADVFKRDIAPALTATGRPVTLYASSVDLALAASKEFHGYPRAGDSGADLVVLPGIETIDATQVDTGLLGHSYFAESGFVLSDIFHLINDGARANMRMGLHPVDVRAGRYWQLVRED
jgi:esterase/lipase superfamily enzyme